MSSDRYEIRGKIGQGGVGAVYRAYDTQLRREVAMKRVLQDGEMNSEDATANLLKEATALSSVQHPHIVTVYDAGIDAEGPYVVMELINGKTLDEMVERGTLTFEDFKEVAVQSQEAMIAAQDLNLVHRDLKPSNVMVSWLPSGRFQVKIVDFGLAKFSAKPSLQTIDHGDAVFGSIFFMAPEQFERTPLDRRTDMYSLGAMYYYALSGEYPFNGDTAPQVMAAHLQNKVPPLIELRPDLPPWVCDWVMWHIRRDMGDRPESARAALEHFLAHDSAHTFGITSSQPLQAAPAHAHTASVPTTAAYPVISGNTAPQPILSPSGQVNPHTAAQQLAAGATTPLNTTGQMVVPGAVAHAVTEQPTTPAPAPVQTPVNPHGMPEQTAALASAAKKPKLTMLHFSIIGAVLVIVIIIMAIALSKKHSEGDINGRVNALITQFNKDDPTAPVPVSKSDANLLLNIIAGKVDHTDTSSAKNILCAATSSDGSLNIDAIIADYLTQDSNLANGTRTVIFKDVVKRRAAFKAKRTDAFQPILDWAVENPNNEATESCISAVHQFANATGDFDKVLLVCQTTTIDSVRDQAASTLGRIIKDAKSPNKLVTKLEKSYAESKTLSQKESLITAVSFAGSSNALNMVKKSMHSGSPKLEIHSILALANWPDATVIDVIGNKVRNSNPSTPEGAQARKSGINSLTKVLRRERLRDKAGIQNLWSKVVDLATNDAERAIIINILGSFNSEWAIGLLSRIREDIRDPKLVQRTNDAIENVKVQIAKQN